MLKIIPRLLVFLITEILCLYALTCCYHSLWLVYGKSKPRIVKSTINLAFLLDHLVRGLPTWLTHNQIIITTTLLLTFFLLFCLLLFEYFTYLWNNLFNFKNLFFRISFEIHLQQLHWCKCTGKWVSFLIRSVLIRCFFRICSNSVKV